MSNSHRERLFPIAEHPLSSKVIYLPSENGHAAVTVHELSFGEVSLSRLANLTGGDVSRDWWVLNSDNFRKRDANPNCGRISWDFNEQEDRASQTRSSLVCKSAGLIITQESPVKIDHPLIRHGPVNHRYSVRLEIISRDREGGLKSNLWQLKPNLKFFLAKPQSEDVGELFIPHPGIANSIDKFNGIVNCWSVSKRTMIRLSSGSVIEEQEKKRVCGFDELMHRETQIALILQHEQYFKRLKK